MQTDEEIDRKKLRYVLYARKSSTDEGSQVRSLPDQIKVCKKICPFTRIKHSQDL
ncbi:MAG: hypothetical protein U0451_00355 [Candidatus Saccharimonadales bacterium]